MWTVYSDDRLIYDPRLDEYKIFEPSLNLELNKTGSFTFTIYSDHPNYSYLIKLKSIITVYQDNYLYFRGRILNDALGFYNERKVSCEGELSFLLDSIHRPFVFPENEGDTATPAAYFTFLINRHNAQVDANHQFTVGNVTVTDSNNYVSRSDTEYSTTWELINQGLINTHGGYLWVRHENGTNYIDYLADFSSLGNQPIEFAKNLLDLATERKGEDIATIIVPVGKKDEETGNRVTISSLPDETTGDIRKTDDYVYSLSGISAYGKIVKKVVWDDVTQPSNLLTKAKAEVANSILQTQTITLTAADLSGAGENFNSFRLGTYVQTSSPPHETVHNLSSTYLVKKLSISLDKPGSNSITVGETIYTFLEENRRNQEKIWKDVETNVTIKTEKAIRELEQRTESSIEQNSEAILSRVSEEYYTKNETDSKVSEVSTEIEQTKNAVEIRFTNFQSNLDAVEDGANAQFTEIKSYIRLENGNVIIGLDDNTFKQIQSATKNSFYEGAVEVAYISNKKMYITDGEFTNSLKIGKFAFVPRANGNTSLIKVVD